MIKKENIYIDSEKRKVVMPPRSMAVLIGEYPERKTTMDVKKKASKNKNERSDRFHGLQ